MNSGTNILLAWLLDGWHNIDILIFTRQHISTRVQDFFDGARWDIGRLLRALPPLVTVQIRAILTCANAPNHIVWRDTPNGSYANKSAWQLVYLGQLPQDSYRLLWSTIIPTVDSFFCWRLWHIGVQWILLYKGGLNVTWPPAINVILRSRPSVIFLHVVLSLTRFGNISRTFFRYICN